MSTALLKFQAPDNDGAPGAGVLAAALAACPEGIAIVENGKLIYSNRSLAQFLAKGGQLPNAGSHTNYGWQEAGFSVDGRTFSLMTVRTPAAISDSEHLALMGRLVGGVAHDFNNLLTGILLYCDLMSNKMSAGNSLARKIDEIRIAAEQGAGLIRQLMSIGREDQEAPQQVAFNYALKEIAPLLQHLVGENVHVNMTIGEGDGMVGVSLAQAQQIILNLVLNARDATPGGGQVHVASNSRLFAGTGPADHIFELTVQDYGTGMDGQTAARIFDPFFTTKAPGRGTGMGLTTVRKIVEDAGGVVSVETAPGKGTQVTVRLPEIPARATASEAKHPPDLVQAETARSQNKRGAAL
jgi:signal transduction histidine kinase